MLSARCVYYKS